METETETATEPATDRQTDKETGKQTDNQDSLSIEEMDAKIEDADFVLISLSFYVLTCM